MSGVGELVYAVPRDRLLDGVAPWRGVKMDAEVPAILARVDSDGSFVLRATAESDRSLKQIIPYLILRDGERLFLMKRTRAGGDARLHDHYTIGVGGHMNPGDETVIGGLVREWREELVADFIPEFTFLGLLNDDEVEVGMHHLGIVFVADAAGRSVTIRETDKLGGSFESLHRAQSVRDSMETWSQLALDALANHDSPTELAAG
jgi:predicted NUDIX family phosphoesterase